MNTFLDLQHSDTKSSQILEILQTPIQKRIFLRGIREQYHTFCGTIYINRRHKNPIPNGYKYL